MSAADELKKLSELHAAGELNDEEYARMKARIVGSGASAMPSVRDVDWGMLIHLSQLLGYVVVGLGFAVPIVLWQITKERDPVIDRHGRVVVNWMITELILGLLCIPLCFVLIGFPLLLLLIALGIIYPIIGAVKAANGEVWRYPGSIPFLR